MQLSTMSSLFNFIIDDGCKLHSGPLRITALDVVGDFANPHTMYATIPGASGFEESPINCRATDLNVLVCAVEDQNSMIRSGDVLFLGAKDINNFPSVTLTLASAVPT